MEKPSITAADLMRQAAAVKTETTAVTETESKMSPGFPKYQLPTTNAIFRFPKSAGKRKVHCPDGIVQAETEAEQKYLEAACRVGNIYLFAGEVSEATLAVDALQPHMRDPK